jgi:hypothetical protein
MKPFFALVVALLLFAACQKDNTTIDLNKGLVVDIPLDGNAKESISGSNGFIYNATLTNNRKGIANTAMQFNRADSAYISFDNLSAVSFTDNIFTISFWVNIDDTLSKMAVLSKRNMFGPYEYSIDNFFGNNSLKFDNWIESGANTVYGIDPLDAEAPLLPGNWQHIVFVADGSKLQVYWNSFLQSGIDYKQAENNFAATTAPLVIGNGGGYNKNYFFNGKIDDIKMYNRALLKEEIHQLNIL